MKQITPEITAHIQSYQVRLISTASRCSADITTDIVGCTTLITLGNLSTLCRDNCVYTFKNTSELTALYYSVLVTAKNLLDYGKSQHCGNYNIGTYVVSRPNNNITVILIHLMQVLETM